MIPSEVTILCGSRPETSDLNFVKLAEFLGLRATLLTIDTESATVDYFEKNLPPHPVCLVASGSTIAQICSSSGFDREFKAFLLRRVAYFLIYAVQPGHSAALSSLSGGALSAISPLRDTRAEYQINPEHRDICRQLAGLSF